MTSQNQVEKIVSQPYKYGFITDIETDKIGKGLNEKVIRLISEKKQEPKFLLDFRLKAYNQWLSMKEPNWANLGYKPINYQELIYYAAPKNNEKIKSLDEVDQNY